MELKTAISKLVEAEVSEFDAGRVVFPEAVVLGVQIVGQGNFLDGVQAFHRLDPARQLRKRLFGHKLHLAHRACCPEPLDPGPDRKVHQTRLVLFCQCSII